MTLTSVSITLTSMSVTSTTVNDFDLCVSDLDLFVSEIKLSVNDFITVNECDYFSWTEVSGFSLIFLSLKKKKIINFNFFSLVHSFSIVQSLSAAFSLHLSTSTGFKSLFMTLVKYCTLTVSMFGC